MQTEPLEYRLRQQALVSELGIYALQHREFDVVARQATVIAAKGVHCDLAKVLRHQPEQDNLLVYAGVGWHPGVVGSATIDAGMQSAAGYALQTGEPVVANHLLSESRFETSQLLIEHGVVRAINVIITGPDRPFGVLEVDASRTGTFDKDDVAFLQALGNVLATAHKRHLIESELEQVMREKDVLIQDKMWLLNELNHRVKNNLQVVSNLIAVEAAQIDDPTAKERMRSVGERVTLLGEIHQHLYQSGQTDEIDFGEYIEELCRRLEIFYSSRHAGITIRAEVEPVVVDAERAVPLALIVNELIANAAKHAFPHEMTGIIRVTLRADENSLEVAVSDNGVGMLAIDEQGFGRLLVNALLAQLAADIETRTDGGTTIVIRISDNACRQSGRP